MEHSKALVVGWKEYGTLPDLGVDRIHIKIDTGARTSAIHTLANTPFTRDNQPWVRFTLAPHQDDDDTTIECELPIKDQRSVTSSNGQTTDRIVVETRLLIGGQERLIEMTLVCRQEMRYRMLLGRQAMAGMVVYPDQSHLTTQNKRKSTP